MNTLVKVVATALAAAVTVLCLPLVGVLLGAFSGWVVGLFFADTIRTTLASLMGGLPAFEMWELGATLGFIGGFFTNTATVTARRSK